MVTSVPSRNEAITFPCRWLPNETFFSLCSRHHRLSDHDRAVDTCTALFGHPRQGSAHDLPNRIEHFVARTEGLFGTAEDIVRNHTILPFYLPFLPEAKGIEALQAMLCGSVQGLRMSLGLTTSIFRADHPLKACTSCMARDLDEFGVAYWHLGHQFPGVSDCAIHRLPLGSSPVGLTGKGTSPWLLPSHGSVGYYAAHNREIESFAEGRDVRSDVSAIALAVGSLGPYVRFEAELLSVAYVEALHRRGLIHLNSRTLRREAVGSQFSQILLALAGCADFIGLSHAEDRAATHVARLVSAARQPTHPLWHIPLIAWLFATWPNFLEAYEAAAKRRTPQLLEEADRPEPPRAPHPRRNGFLKLVQDRGWSVSRAARCVAVDVGTGMAWAAQAGIRVARRPSRLKSDVRLKMVERLRDGAPKLSVAQILGVSIESVTRLLRTEIGLHRAWKQAMDLRQADRARDDWVHALQTSKGSVKTARVIAPAAYAWLYRNEPDWLIERNSRFAVPRPASKPRVDWKARDSKIASEVARMALRLREAKPGGMLHLRDFYRGLPVLAAKQAKLSQLPETRRALRTALHTQS